VKESVVDGPGIRMVVFAQGCPHACPGCHNPETHDFSAGKEYSIEDILKIYDKNPLLRGITLTGGEPLSQAAGLLALAREIKQRGGDVFCYTGYTFEELAAMMRTDNTLAELLRLVDTLVDGRYIDAERDLLLRFRGSKNQRVLDMKRSLAKGKTVWAKGY
jgi:anaerobic ribonucleoside-triphosphate reductase activating protein